MNNFLTFLAMTMIVVLTALFALPLMINWDDYRRDFEVRLSDIMGARVELDGSLNVRLLPSPFVRAENLRIGDSGITGKPILEVKELKLFVSLPPLLRGVVEARRVSLDQPKVVLQFDEKGQATFKSAQYRNERKKDDPIRVQDAALSGFKLSPKLISLKNVNIINGEIVLQTVRAKKRLAPRRLPIKGIDGVLSAVTLNGPFYFNGSYVGGDAPHNVRLAVGAMEETGSQIEGYVQFPQEERVAFKGQLQHEGKNWRLKGQVRAGLGALSNELELDRVSQKSDKKTGNETGGDVAGEDKSGDAAAVNNSKEGSPALRQQALGLSEAMVITSAVDLSPGQFILDKIDIRGGSLAQPQTVKGRAVIDWKDELALTARMEGQVVDLNAIYGAPQTEPGTLQGRFVAPGAALSALSKAIYGQANTFEQVDLEARFSQLLVGRGDARDVNLKIKGDRANMRVETFSARLPGSGRISVEGAFTEKDKQSQFDGKLFLRGLQFDQLLSWAAPDVKVAEQFGRGKFMISGNVAFGAHGFALEDALGDFGNTSLRLRFVRQNDAAPEGGELAGGGGTKLSVTADQVDVADLVGRDVGFRDYKAALQSLLALGGAVDTIEQQGAGGPVARAKVPNLVVEFLIDKLMFSDASLRQVALLWEADDQGGHVRSFSLRSERGGRIDFENGGAEGSSLSRYLIEASQRAGLEDLIKLIGSEALQDERLDSSFIDRFLPLRLAVLREEDDQSVHHRVDGMLAGSDAAFSILSHPGDETAPITLFGGMENKDGRGVAAMLLPFDLQPPPDAVNKGRNGRDPAESAQLTVMAKGTLESGFNGQLIFNKAGLSMQYDGVLGLEQRRFASDGVLHIEAGKSRDALALFGMEGIPLSEEEEGPLKGEMTFVHTEKGYAISAMNASLGSTKLKGTGLMEVTGGVENLRLAVSTSRLALGALLAPLENGQDARGADEIWSTKPFKTRLASERLGDGKSWRGSFSLGLNELAVTDQLSMTDVQILWQSDGERIEVTKFEGAALGGVLSAKGVLRPAPNGYSLNGVVSVKNGQLEEVGGRSEVNLGTGVFDMSLSMSGTGHSVAALVGNLVGQGNVALRNGRLQQISPKRLRTIARQFLKGGGNKENLRELIEADIEKASSLEIGTIDVGLELIDGTVKLRQSDLGIRPGLIGLEGNLDLKGLNWSGRWSIDPEGDASLAGLPPVYRRMSGSFDFSSEVVGRLDVDDFARHLDLKFKERELRELEKAKRQREERRKLEEAQRAEEERLRLEAEKARKKKEEEERLKNIPSNDLDWSDLPSLVP